MSQGDKSRYYQALKKAGVSFSKTYREYTTDELSAACSRLVETGLLHPETLEPIEPAEATHQPDPGPEPTVPHPDDPRVDPGDDEGVPDFGDLEEFYQGQGSGLTEDGEEIGEITDVPETPTIQQKIDRELAEGVKMPHPAPQPEPVVAPPVQERAADTFAGQHQNTHDEMEPIRREVNEAGEVIKVWFQEEVQKPAFPKPRGRRVLTYTDTGTKKQQVKVGDYVETFEVAGDQTRTSEVKITLPSYQVGIYLDRRFPFKIHTYNGVNGFDLFDVENYFGGSEMVPTEVKRSYVANDLCYDIRSVIRFIETEYRRLQLAGGVTQ